MTYDAMTYYSWHLPQIAAYLQALEQVYVPLVVDSLPCQADLSEVPQEQLKEPGGYCPPKTPSHSVFNGAPGVVTLYRKQYS